MGDSGITGVRGPGIQWGHTLTRAHSKGSIELYAMVIARELGIPHDRVPVVEKKSHHHGRDN